MARQHAGTTKTAAGKNIKRAKGKDVQIKLVYANVRGLMSKIASTKEILSETEATIVCVTETHLSANKGIVIDGYSFFGRAREGRPGGGVGILVKSTMKQIISPHYSQRDIEIVWASMHRSQRRPVHIGVYYGKQEGISQEEIKEEMDKLTEEILEMKAAGEIILCMDGNAKIGLLGENTSRNGKLIKEVFEECQLEVMNAKDICVGVVTRQNRKKESEKSAIDFIVATYEASQWFKSMTIDELGEFRLRNKNDSDHNTVIAEIQMREIETVKETITSDWNYKATPEKWQAFRDEIQKAVPMAIELMGNWQRGMTERYTKWERLIYKAAIKTIGRTTFKPAGTKRPSNDVKRLRKERTKCKKDFEKERDYENKGNKLEAYINKQKELAAKIEEEEEGEVKVKFKKMIEESNKGGFWRARRRMNRDEASTWMVTKGEDGHRIFDPEENKENIASHYEELYKEHPTPPHPYHKEVHETVMRLSDRSNIPSMMTPSNDAMPSRDEIKEIIQKKKDKKATTDWKNILLKKGGEPMVDLIMPVMKAFWLEEEAPSQFNRGTITNIWKGKGDRECMGNQRGITVSSSICTIPEEVLNRRIIKTIKFSQAQAGGQKGASPTDHIFILRNLMALAKKEGRHLLMSFFDVKKAYDRANMKDMLYILHKNGFNGKSWRLTQALNVGLTAKVKTKAGLTREIKRETGGKQGGKLMVPMFAKAMDTLMEEMEETGDLGIEVSDNKIPALIFMDDVTSLAEGYDQQEQTLEAVHTFGLKHKIEWGQDKCKVMEFGKQREERRDWKLGEKTIENCKSYKYLGEIIARDGSNEENLAARFSKVKGTVRAINTCGKTKIMRRIEVEVLTTLHNAVTLPTLLYNSETWPLNATIRKELDKMELWAWKSMLGLPKTTPTAAVMFVTGALYASIRVQIKQLIYLHKVLQKTENHWTITTLKALRRHNTGWAKQVEENLDEWQLETNWDNIRTKSKNEWKKQVYAAAEKKNREKILGECFKKERGSSQIKTKTRRLVQTLENESLTREPQPFMIKNNKLIARAYIMGQYGMLQCAANFSNGYGGKNCQSCSVEDNESHRMNHCPEWSNINLANSNENIDYESIYSENVEDSMKVVRKIIELWDLGNNRNCMRSTGLN